MTKKNKGKRKKSNLTDNSPNYHSIIKGTRIAACFIDSHGKILISNPPCDKCFGVKKGKLQGSNLKDFISAADFKKIKKRQKKEIYSFEIEILENKENNRILNILTYPIFEDEEKYTGSLAVLEDLTIKNELEENFKNRVDKLEKELVFRGNLLSSLLHNTPDRIYFKDKKSRFVKVSRSFVKTLGFKNSKEIIGKTDFDFYTKSHAEQAYKEEQEIIKNKIPVKGKIIKETALDGKTAWVSTTKVPWYDEKGEVIGILGITEDITKTKELEEELKNILSEFGGEVGFKSNLLAFLLDNMPELIYFKDEKSRFVKVSKSLADWSNVESADDLLGKTDFDFYKKDEAKIRFEEERSIMKTGNPIINKEEKYTTPDGREGWTSTTKLPLYDEKGKITGTLGISRDITEKKRLEKKLKERLDQLGEEILFKSNLLTSLLDNIPENIYFKDKKSRFVAVSKSQADWSNVESVDDLLGKTDFDFYKKDEAKIRFEEERRIMKTGNPIINKEEKYTTPDGKEGWVSTTKIPRYDKKGNIIGTLGISRDITEIKEAEKEIYKLNDLIEQSTNSILRMNPEMRINYANKATKSLLGYTFSELKGKTIEFLMAEANSEQIYKKIYKKVSKGEKYSEEHLSIRKNGSVFFCSMNIIPLFDENGKVYGYMASLMDITKERKAREELVFRKNLLDSFLELTPDKVFFKDRDCRFLEVSKSKAERYNLTREEIIGKSDFSLQKEEVAEKYFEEEQEIMNKERPLLDQEAKTTNPDGTPRWISYTKVPRYDKEGNVIGIIGISRDITRLKKIEEELRIEEELLSNTLESMEDGILVLDENFHVTYWNNSMEKITGISREKVLNSKKTPWEFFPNLKKAKVDIMMKKAMNGEVVKKEKIQYQKDTGSKFFTSEMYLPLRNPDKKIYGIVGVVKEITKEIETEETLKESEEKYRTLVENSREGICIFRDDKFLFVNDQLCKILRYSKEELYAIDMWQIISEEDRSIVKEIEKRREKGEEMPNVYEANIITNDRDIRFCEFSIRKITYQGLESYMGIIRDITEYKDMEKEREKADRLESLGLLAGGIAHDFNNFLTGILGNISLAKLHLDSNEESYSILEESERAAQSARSLTQQLLTFSKGGTPVKSNIELEDVIKNSARFVLSGSNVRCIFEFPDNFWGVKADKGQLSQAFNNLILNANQAMPGGGEVLIKGKNITITKNENLPLKEGKHVMVEVRDSGVGIPPEITSKIFDPFFTTKQKGSGLGLSTVFSIIKRHEGHITVESVPEKGTSFFIYLPATEKGKLKKEEIERKIFKGKGKVLIMDDKSFVRNTAVKALRLFGYEVEGAADGEEAIKEFKKAIEAGNPFDVVILDLTIPGGMGGEDTLKKLKEINPEIRAIVSSGYSEDPVMSEYKKHGFDAIVNKPYQYEELGEAVRRVMKQNS